MREKVEAHVDIAGTVYDFQYTCDHAYVTMDPNGRTVIVFENGMDERGPVSSDGFRLAHRVTKRPIE